MKITDLKILAAGTDCRAELVDKLRQLGYKNILETDDGTAAWNILKTKEIEIVFADWHLHQFDGLVLLQIMAADKHLCKIPVVLMVAAINRERVIDAGNNGVSAIMLEPITKEGLKEKIETIFSQYDLEKDLEAETLFKEGEARLKKGELDKALESFSKILSVYEKPEVYYNIGYIKAAQGKYDESIIAFRKAIKIDQRFAEAYQKLGEVYAKIGLKDKAEEALQKAGEIYMERNMSREAEIAFQEVLKLNPNTTNIYNSLGILYRRRQDFAKAEQAYEKALNVSAEDENIFFNYGRACYEVGNFQKAKMLFTKALEIFPGFNQAEEMLKKTEAKLTSQ